MDLSLSALQTAYSSLLTPTALISELYPLLKAETEAFITLAPLKKLLKRCEEIEEILPEDRGPLWGAPFAVKDNIDILGFPTTAGCRAFFHLPEKTALCIKALEDAGAIAVGKANMDQFASGLVGTRSDYGIARNAFDSRFIPGGSSSGSASLVGLGLVSFAIATDTAGSGRVPAMFNGCVGIKPSIGRVSTIGVTPACLSIDCVCAFCTSVDDGRKVVKVMEDGTPRDQDPTKHVPIKMRFPDSSPLRFGVPDKSYLSFCGPGGLHVEEQLDVLMDEAVARLEKLGYKKVEIDFAPFAAVAALLYGGAFVAERISGIRKFLEQGGGGIISVETIRNDERLMPVTRAIFSGGARYSAVDLFDDLAKLWGLRATARTELDKIDFMVVPTAPAHYTIKEIMKDEADPPEKATKGAPRMPRWAQNANLGRFHNFVNMMDLCGVSVPSGVYVAAGEGDESGAERAKHLKSTGNPKPKLPFGVTLLTRAWLDEWIWDIAEAFHEESGLGCGPRGHGVKN